MRSSPLRESCSLRSRPEVIVSKAVWLPPLLVFAVASALCAAPEGDSKQDEAVLVELDEALRKQGPSRTVVTYTSKELEVSGTLTLSYVPSKGRLFMAREEASPEAGKSYAILEPGSATYWDASQSQRLVYDLEPLLDGLHAFMNAVSQSRAEKALTREAFAAKLGPHFQLGIGVHAMGTRPTLEIAVGVSTLSRASWLAEVRNSSKRTLTLTPKEVKVELPGGKSYVIDRATGFFRSQRQVLQHSTFTLEASPLEPLAAFPEAKPPAKTPVEELPVDLFVDLLRKLVLESATGFEIGAKGKVLARLSEGFTQLAAAATRARLHHLSRSETRRFVLGRLESGATLESLRSGIAKESAELAKLLKAARIEIQREEDRELQILRTAVLAKVPADSPQAKALETALSVETVRAALLKGASPKSHLEAVLATLR